MSTRFLIAFMTMALVAGCSGLSMEAGLADGGAQEGDDDNYGADDDDDWGDDDDDDPSGGCEIKGTVPVDGDPTAYYRDPIQVFFSSAVDDVTIDLEDVDGVIPGSTILSEDGLVATFDPYDDEADQHLTPLTAYQAHVEAPGCATDWTFTTSELGTDLDGFFELNGASYIVYMDQAELVTPAALQSVFGSLGPGAFLLGITDVSSDELSLIAGGVTDGEPLQQDLCSMTADLTVDQPAILAGSHLSLTPVTLDIPFEQESWSLDTEYWLNGAQIGFHAELTPDGTALTEGRIEGIVDGFGLDALMADLTDDHDTYWQGSTCDLLESLGVPCTACPGNPQQQSCIEFELHEVEAILAGSVGGVVEITAADAANCY